MIQGVAEYYLSIAHLLHKSNYMHSFSTGEHVDTPEVTAETTFSWCTSFSMSAIVFHVFLTLLFLLSV